SSPAGAFHTPRVASVRAKTPATAPHGTNSSSWPSRSGFDCTSRGKNSAAFLLLVPTLARPPAAAAGAFQLLGGSTTSSAPRDSQYVAASLTTWVSTSAVSV